ncbi:MAG: ShlB/FhaC/HecB family hemolysin secretion/activation protein [Desulfobacterales bacterium]
MGLQHYKKRNINILNLKSGILEKWSDDQQLVIFLLGTVLIFALLFKLTVSSVYAGENEDIVQFEIRGFEIEGNTLLKVDELKNVVKDFTGPGKTSDDVEKARDSLEKLYHKAGYPTVLVNIPEQTLDNGLVRLVVLESKIGKVKVTGNRYFTMEKIFRGLPSFRPGEILYIPGAQGELAKINRNKDFKVAPVLTPGREPGTVDVELQVKDRLPLHGSLELNNRNTHDTTDLRLNGMISFDNLWQKEHSISLQYQTSPQELSEVEVFAASYVLPVPWKDGDIFALYGVLSDSETAFGEGFNVIGKGKLFGARYVSPLPPSDLYSHNITIGLDYKDFDESLGYNTTSGDEPVKTPLAYLPLSFAYSGSSPDTQGITQISASFNMVFRGLVTDRREFEDKRYKASGNYLYARAGIERSQKLPLSLGLFIKLDGQIANQPLPSNEQYSAGGMESVRGYKESEVLGDNAIHGIAQISGPDLSGILGFREEFGFLPYLFYDYANVKTQDSLPGQDGEATIHGAGVGMRGNITRFLEYELDWAVALKGTDKTNAGESQIYFKMKGLF